MAFVSDLELADALGALPHGALAHLLARLDAGCEVIVAYGWAAGGGPAERGCPASLVLTREEYRGLLAGPDGGDLRHLAEQAYPRWAARWVDSLEAPLPSEALRRLRAALVRCLALSS
jgi:hypothetical protein